MKKSLHLQNLEVSMKLLINHLESQKSLHQPKLQFQMKKFKNLQI
jgi:hypothetical protein